MAQNNGGQKNNGKPQLNLSLTDRIVSYFSPEAGLNRIKYKASLSSLQSSGYFVAGSIRRAMRGWLARPNTADVDINFKLSQARASSRDLYMNSAIASGSLKRIVTNTVGFGLLMQSRIDGDLLGLDMEQQATWERNTEREFKLWADSKLCDVTTMLNFFELQDLALLSVIMSGDVFVALPFIERKGMPYDLRIKLIEADMVMNPMGTSESFKTSGGVEVDDDGAPVNYWFRKQSDSNTMIQNNTVNSWEKIPVFGTESGKRNVLHLLYKERPGQRRGVPILAPVFEDLKQISRLKEAELMGAIIASFFSVFIKSDSGQGMQPGFPDNNTVLTDPDSSGARDTDEKLYEMGSGNIMELSPDESIELADPKRPNAAFEPFYLAIVKQIGSAIEIPFEQMLLHFSASYSASRAALLEAWKFYRKKRTWLVTNFCQPVYEQWLTEAVIKGRIKAPGFFEDPIVEKAWSGTKWTGPGQGQIDPLKETKASVLKIKNNLSTHEDEHVALTGGDWEKTIDRASREKALLESKGLAPAVEATTNENDNGDNQEVTIADP